MEYHEIANDIKVQMFDFDTHFKSLESALGQLKKNMYVKINETISRLKKDLYDIRNNLRHRLLVQQLKIDKNSFDINQSISDIKHLHRSNARYLPSSPRLLKFGNCHLNSQYVFVHYRALYISSMSFGNGLMHFRFVYYQ